MGSCQSASSKHTAAITPIIPLKISSSPALPAAQVSSEKFSSMATVPVHLAKFDAPVRRTVSEVNVYRSSTPSTNAAACSTSSTASSSSSSSAPVDCIVHNNLQFPVRLVVQYTAQANGPDGERGKETTHVREFMSFPRTKKVLRFRAGVRIVAVEANQGWSRASVRNPIVISADSSILLNLMYGDEALDEIEHFRATSSKRQVTVSQTVLEPAVHGISHMTRSALSSMGLFKPLIPLFPGQPQHNQSFHVANNLHHVHKEHEQGHGHGHEQEQEQEQEQEDEDEDETCYDTDSKCSSISLESALCGDDDDFGSNPYWCPSSDVGNAPFCICGYDIAVSHKTRERRPVLYGVCAATRHPGNDSDLY
eukprot:ANDGO_03020.mRNA.1 hypothetical protein